MTGATDKLQRWASGKADHAISVGLVGKGIAKSRTPAMHEAEAEALGLSFAYSLLDTAELAEEASLATILDTCEQAGFAGLNITYPYKVDVIALLDTLSDAARRVGAVNTVVMRDGKRSGHNTDLWGFAQSFRRNMAGMAADSVLLLGAGGAGAAVAHALADCGVTTLLLYDDDAERAGQLAQRICTHFGAGRAQAMPDPRSAIALRPDGIVNATPVGMSTLPGIPLAPELIDPGMWVADIVYFPLETELLRVARAKSCHTLSGAGMAVFQAVRAFELFTGRRPDVARMEVAFRAFDETAPS